MQNVVGTNK
jgi:uncharacterized repeat protein (TIGR01451 family)